MNKLHLLLSILFCMLVYHKSNAQVAINTDNSNPDASAMLDVKSTDKGLLLPRMTQAQRTAITTPASGLLVYQTDNPSGFYYYSGAGWFRLSLQNEGWSTTGNTGTNPANNFIGTIDNQPLSFRLNNSPAGKFDHIKGNYFIGKDAGLSNNDGLGNIAIGNRALNKNISSACNIALGDSALYSFKGGLGENIAIGRNTLRSDTSGYLNIAIGSYSLYSNSSGKYNIAIGINSLYLNTEGDFNTGLGAQTLNKNTTGYENVAIGIGSLAFNTTGYQNTGVGRDALRRNTDGYSNTAVGTNSLFYNSGGLFNSALGQEALYKNTTGYLNTATGYWALYENTTGVSNTALGEKTLQNNTTGSVNTAVGASALIYNKTGNANTACGLFSMTNNSSGGYNSAFGVGALQSDTSGSFNSSVGSFALGGIITGSYNTGLGAYSGSSLSYQVNNVTTVGHNSGFITTPDNHINIGNTSNVWIGGQVNWGVWSDSRIKKDVQENVPGLSFILKLKPVTYNLDIHKQSEMVYSKGSDTLTWPTKYEIETITQSGFIAQEVKKAAEDVNYDFSGVVAPKSEEGLYSLRYAEFVVPLVKAVQELSKSNDEQQAYIEKQQQKIEELEKAIKNLSQRINRPNRFFPTC